MSRLPFELALALRYLRPKRTFVSVITLISIIGVTLGVAVLIVVISVMTGFDKELRDKILGFNAHLRVTQYARKAILNWQQVSEAVATNRHVQAAAPYILGQALVETQPEFGDPAVFAQYIRGIDPEAESRITVLPESIMEGEYNLRGYRILVGRILAENFGLRIGDRLAIYSPNELQKLRDAAEDQNVEAPLPDEYEIAGIFDVGYYEYNASFVMMSLLNAQQLYELGEAVHGLQVILDDPYRADQVRKEILRNVSGDLYVATWLEDNSTFLDALVVEKNVMFYLLFFIMIVAAFGITSAQITFAVQKTREIGMLKALGASSWQIMCVFLGQSLMVGVIGVLSGLGLGMLAVSYRNEFLAVMNRFTGFELFPAKIYMFSELPALIVAQDIAVICGGSLFICLLAGLLPAINAARLRPVEALRHE